MIKFLIPVNFAPYTINAIKYCAALAHHLKGEITMVYCYTHLLSNEGKEDEGNFISSYDDALKGLKKLKSEVLEDFESIDKDHVKLEVLEGYPEDIIPEFCESYAPDLIVMGTKSKGETIKELLGSVTLDVITKVQNPVMAVPNNYEFVLDKLTNILFVTDFEKCQYTSLHKLVNLVGAFDTKIHSVQYCPHGKDKAVVEKLTEYSDYCKSTYRNQPMVCNYIEGANIIDSTEEYITANNIDMLAITRRKRNAISQLLQPSRTKKILFNAEIPTLFFHQ